MKKQAGILMPVASLPNRFGSGDFGPDAYRFADAIAEAGFSIWQLLPLNPLGYGNSPYQPYSSYAMDEIYISIDLLEKEGLVSKHADYRKRSKTIDYPKVRAYRERILREAFANFKEDDDYHEFVSRSGWLEPYAVFRAFKQANDLRSWEEWPAAMRDYPLKREMDLAPYEEEIRYHRFLQYMADKQWDALKTYVNKKGIEIMGDIPFYVGQDSADCWNGRPNFLLTKSGKPRFIAGVPPDYFSATGQRWGNPIYDWKYMEKDGFSFWTERIGYSTQLFDIIRLDHFRAFDTYWKIPASCPTAQVGKWITAPGYKFFDHLFTTFPDLRIVAEDLGDMRPQVYKLRDYYNFPGMHIFQFEFDPNGENTMNANSIVYTGTHDNATIKGWVSSMSPEQKKETQRWFRRHKIAGANIYEKMLRFVLNSEPKMAVIPMADWLYQGASSTLNRPGTVGSPNWEWRLPDAEPFEQKLPLIKTMIRESGRQ